MVKARRLHPLPLLDDPSIHEYFQEQGFKPIHVRKLHRRMINLARASTPATTVHDLQQEPIRGVPPGLSQQLASCFAITTSKVVEAITSKGGDTTKLLIELQDKELVEAVIIRHHNRTTLCVSSQIGCQMGCAFCATGTMGIKGNLLAGEICEQLYHANLITPITNVVFMGQGEPLQNFDSVLSAIRMMTDVKVFSLCRTSVTLSTVGVVSAMRRLTREAPYVTLALSLHAPNQEIRQRIVPSARAFPLEKIMDALIEYLDVNSKTRRRALIEYVMLYKVNDREEHAHELGRLLSVPDPRMFYANLIPYNPTAVEDHFETPPEEDVLLFQKILQSYGIITRIRCHHGRDIGGACGQLALDHTDRSHVGTRGGIGDIEDLISGSPALGTKRGGSGKNVRRRMGVKRRVGAKEDSSEEEDEEVEQEEDGEDERLHVEDAVAPPQSVMLPYVSCSRMTWVMSSGGVMIAVMLALANISP